jgi:hypothetical protein
VRAVVFGLLTQVLALGIMTLLSTDDMLLLAVSYAWLLGFFMMILAQWHALRTSGDNMKWLMRVLLGLFAIPIITTLAWLWVNYE